MKNNPFVLFSLSLCIACTLVNDRVFGSPTLAAVFLFMITAALTAGVIGLSCIWGNKTERLIYPLPIYLFALLLSYYLVDGSGNIDLRYFFLLVCGLLFLSSCFSFSSGQIHFGAVCRVICMMGALESLICLLQYVGVAPSKNDLFAVTGSWINPNVTAMFLAMAVPAFWVVLSREKVFYKTVFFVLLVLCVIALFVLRCRTAWVGAGVAAVFMLNRNCGGLQRLQRSYRSVGLLLVGGIVLILAVCLYRNKQASTEGRLFIWKISLGMSKERPITGYGFGTFEVAYNRAQAGYFAQGTASPKETRNASYTHMGYNEYVEALVEGGIIGLVLLGGVFVSLLIRRPSREGGAYAAVLAFAVMSLFNFTIQAVPVMCLFVIYGAALAADTEITGRGRALLLPSVPTGVILCAVGLYTSAGLYSLAKAYALDRRLQLTLGMSNAEFYEKKMSGLEGLLAGSSSYWWNYGDALFSKQKYRLAMEKYDHAKRLTADPDLYMRMGECLYKIGDYEGARNAIKEASYIEPDLLAPHFALLRLYLGARDTLQAIKEAETLLAMQPKGTSDKAFFYKKEAQSEIERLKTR